MFKDGPIAPQRILIIACGALAREIHQLRRINGWQHVDLQCLDARLHNRPAEIPAQLRDRIRAARGTYKDIFVAYADCGTGGAIDRMLREEGGIERLPGPHCYATFAGQGDFAALADEEPGCFYLTDFLVRHFDSLVVAALGLDRHPKLRDAYFGNYRRVVYLAQTHDESLLHKARAAAKFLDLEFFHVPTGYGELGRQLEARVGA